MNFKNLHQQKEPLLLANVWDVSSAQIAEKLNFKAIGTSSSAISNSLGYQDGEEMSFEELAFVVKRISTKIKIPLSVDLEAGYSRDPKIIATHIKQLAQLGVVGINLEDSIVEDVRVLLSPEGFSKTISEIKNILEKEGINIFLNIRTDTFLLNHPDPVAETIRRIRLYEKAGANGIFVPCITHEDDIKSIVENTPLPINVMCMPNLPDFSTLKKLGVKRISMGNFLYDQMNVFLEKNLNTIIQQNSFQHIFQK
ncbi:MAG: isocitrate lyase/phosphoenolpyruvate mutase family protein [Saprospiraceae bacterium]